MKVLRITRSVLVTALGFGLACSLPSIGMAKVHDKVCSDCHTMHNSQETAADLIASWSISTGAKGALLANTCYGCHTGDAGISAIGAPQVITSGGPQSDGILPGGFFSAANENNEQHTITAIGLGTDLAAPPGWDIATSPRTTATAWTNTALVCAGTYGCHGTIDQPDQGAAVSGIHHRATALGYRGLAGINGVESTLYNVKYNGYSAVNKPSDASSYTTISALCGECHSKFHDVDGESDVLSSGAWIRHPTDFALDSANQSNDAYTSYGAAGNAYNEEVPVGWVNNNAGLSTNSGTTDFQYWGDNPGTSVSAVICLSCHRAHGSTNHDLLRWDYAGMIAGSPTAAGATPGKGCFRCHTTKDDA